jgi:hypothetical protein
MIMQLATDQVWEAIEKELFAVIGMRTPQKAHCRAPLNGTVELGEA